MPDAPEQTTPRNTPADLTGRTLGDCQVLRRLGVGGMGQVYLARQLSLKRDVALKFLRNDLTANPTALKRFEAEAQVIARLNHPNIVQVFWVGEADGMRYMALEYVEGRNLRDHLARKGPPELPVALSIMRQVAQALQKAHDHGVVHRDIKPENILLTRKVEVKVTDFGLSRFFAGAESLNLTQSGVTLGTPLYLSPEQAQGSGVDHRSDVYSFGVTCYHLLAGEPPFLGTTAVEVALKHVTEQPRPLADLRPDLPVDLCGMVHKMMAKNAADRYQSVRDILRDLAAIRDGLSLVLNPAVALSISGTSPAASSSPSVTAIPTRPPRWGRWVLAGLACVVAAAAGAVAFAVMNPPPAPEGGVTPTTSTPPPPAAAFPEIRTTDRLTTTRERELIALIGTRGTKGDRVIEAYIELGMMYVRDRRLDEARATFERLAAEKLDSTLSTVMAERAGRLGQAVVLAHQDRANASVELIEKVLRDPIPKMPGKGGPGARFVQSLLLQFPELALAVSEALNRDAANLGVQKFDKQELETLRLPRGMPR
jgi:serine/threonine-protein kinase